ncbi:MAG TPA: hypothetical protein VGR66_07690, partial [Candidatus Eisenbacteria bacterium]|nr:hypothetical protein [Candidatus Eisenbacteria bacterium]
MKSWARARFVFSILAILFPVTVLAAAEPATTAKPSATKTAAPADSKATVTKTKTSVEGVHPSRATGRDTTVVGAMREQAIALKALYKTPAVWAFLDSTRALPDPGTRTIYFDSTRQHFYSDAQVKAMSEGDRAKLMSRPMDSNFYYNTRYGTPLAYARALDLVAQQGVKSFSGMKIVDYGYGGIGHLRLLALQGANVTGVDVDPLLPLVYSDPRDQGKIGKNGKLTLVNGRFPADPGIADQVGTDYDLFISKNTLKHGYIHPTRPADKRQLVDLGVDDSTFVAAVRGILKPGGYVMIYNLSPPLSRDDAPYQPWTDGHDPFPRSLWENSGFEV